LSAIDDSTPASDLQLSDCLLPDWQVALSVRAVVTTRNGGVSAAPFGRWRTAEAAPGGLNLGFHTGDDAHAVELNRRRLSTLTGATPAWLTQVHGCGVVQAEQAILALQQGAPALSADASVTDRPGVACVVMVAGVNPDLRAFLGPTIGAQTFEVGAEVRAAFLAAASHAEREATDHAFVPCNVKPGKYLADLLALAHLRLARVGIVGAAGGHWCTVSDPERFYSYRRDGKTGRFAGLIWIDPTA